MHMDVWYMHVMLFTDLVLCENFCKIIYDLLISYEELLSLNGQKASFRELGSTDSQLKGKTFKGYHHHENLPCSQPLPWTPIYFHSYVNFTQSFEQADLVNITHIYQQVSSTDATTMYKQWSWM